MNQKEFNCDFFSMAKLDQIINQEASFAVIIIFQADEIEQLDEIINRFLIPIILIGKNQTSVTFRKKSSISYFNEKSLDEELFIEKINDFTIYKDFNNIIDIILKDTEISALIYNQKGVINYINRPFTQQTGYNKNDIIGQHVNILKSTEHSLMFYDNILETTKNGLKWAGNLKIKRKDGTSFWEYCVIKPLREIQKEQYYIIIALNRNEIINNRESHTNEIKMAASIQNSILSKPLTNKKISINGKYYPLDEISGDTYHWESLNEDKYIVLLCDVVGHGIGSALVTTVISSIVRDLRNQWRTGKIFLEKLNNQVIKLLSQNKNSKDYYFTAVFLEIDTLQQEIKYFNCGHPPIYYFNKDKLDQLHTKNFPIGLFEDVEFKFDTIQYDNNNELLLYTDGLKDLDMDYDSGLNILETILNRYDKESSDLLSYIEHEYLEHYFDKVKDDITLINIELF